MNTDHFLDNLEKQNLVKPEILAKLRTKISKSSKRVSAESIAKYLIDKGVLTRFQAKQLLEQKIQEDLELKVPKEQVDDTNELFKDFEEFRAPAKDPSSRATRADNAAGLEVLDEGDLVDAGQSIPVVEVEHEATLQYPFEPPAAIQDPLVEEYAAIPLEEAHAEPLTSFTGKKPVKNQWESRWLFIGSGILGFLILLAVILSFTLFRTDVDKMWETAQDNFNKTKYQQAINDYHKFAESYSSDVRVPTAKMRIANCELRIPYDTGRWETTLERIRTVLPRLREELDVYEKPEEFDDLRDELSVIIPGTTLGFTIEALAQEDIELKKSLLALAEEANTFVHNADYVPTSRLTNPGVAKVVEDLQNNISMIKRQIQMENDYTAGLSEIKLLTTEGKTQEAFRVYYSLTREKYPELRARQPLIDAMSDVSRREAQLVTAIDFQTPSAAEVQTPIKSTVVVATRSNDNQVAGLSEEMLVYLVSGALHGVRARDGQHVWREFVGVQTTTDPVWLDPDSKTDIIAKNAASHQLMRIGAATGEVLWNVDIGEPFADPFVTSDSIIVTTLSGKVVEIDPIDGVSGRGAQLPQAANLSGASRETFVFQPGSHSNVYLISKEDWQCRDVFYLAHDPNTIAVPPFIISGHVVIAVNGPGYCNLHILRTENTDEGVRLVRAQPAIRMDGQVTTPIVRYSRWGLVMSDVGDLRMIELNLSNKEEPLTVVADGRFDRDRNTRHFLLADEGFLWTVGEGMRQYKIQKQMNGFRREALSNNLDDFIGPLYKYGTTLFHIRHRNESALVSVSAVDAKTHDEIWRTDFAAPLAGPPIVGEELSVISSQGDVFHLDGETWRRGVTGEPASRGSTVVQNLVFDQLLTFGPDSFVATGPRRSILSLDLTQQPPNKLSDLPLSADRQSCQPVTLGELLLVPLQRGQVFLVHPRTGQPVGAPFQPPLQPNVEIQWRRPAVVNSGSEFVIAEANGRFFLVTAEDLASLQKLDEYQFSGSVLSPLVNLDQSVIAVCDDGGTNKLVAMSYNTKIAVQASVDLPGGYVSGPMKVGQGVAVVLDTGQLAYYDSQLQQRWLVDLPADKVTGEPAVVDGQVFLAFQSGAVRVLDIQTGQTIRSIDLGQPISHPPITFQGKLFVAGLDGTLHEVEVPGG